jgi:hypothetical protein
MLASTMQFSSNRRNQATGSPSGKPAALAAIRGPGNKRLFPQDPTACPAPGPSPIPVPQPRQAGKRTSRTRKKPETE